MLDLLSLVMAQLLILIMASLAKFAKMMFPHQLKRIKVQLE
jgi:hypothetical protein